MTTILADARRGVMVSDSGMTDGDRQWKQKKVFHVGPALIGFAGSEPEFGAFIDWYRSGMEEEASFPFGDSSALVMTPGRLFFFDTHYTRLRRLDTHFEAIGTGAKGAICAYEALGFKDPARAVRIAVRHDGGSRGPVRTYRLKETT